MAVRLDHIKCGTGSRIESSDTVTHETGKYTYTHTLYNNESQSGDRMTEDRYGYAALLA